MDFLKGLSILMDYMHVYLRIYFMHMACTF